MAKTTTRQSGKKPRPVPSHRNGAEFDAISDADKERVWEYYEHELRPEDTRPLTPAERQKFESDRRKGRPKVGRIKVISVGLERDLIEKADLYAKQQGISRAELVARGHAAVLPGGKGR